MPSISDLLDDLPEDLQAAIKVQGYSIGNRSVQRPDVLRLFELYERMKRSEAESSSMCSLGQICPLS